MKDLDKIRLGNPNIVLTKGYMPLTITVSANTPTLIYRANEARVIVLSNINNPNATPLFIGPNDSVTHLSGYPITNGERITIGMLENTAIYGYSVAELEVYVIDTGV